MFLIVLLGSCGQGSQNKDDSEIVETQLPDSLITEDYIKKTYVPDDNFEAYLEASGMGDGIANNDSVTKDNIRGVTTLYVSDENIADLIGIEDFTALTGLNCHRNQLTSLDVSNNTALTELYCGENQFDCSPQMDKINNLEEGGC